MNSELDRKPSTSIVFAQICDRLMCVPRSHFLIETCTATAVGSRNVVAQLHACSMLLTLIFCLTRDSEVGGQGLCACAQLYSVLQQYLAAH
jgi:hypothetical protein